MRLDEFIYELPASLVAQYPLPERDSSRLMVLDRPTGRIEHRTFHDIVNYLSPGDCLVLNQTRVLPARLLGRKPTGGEVEVLLLESRNRRTWEALVSPARRVRAGTEIEFEGGLVAQVRERTGPGRFLLEFAPADPWPLIEAQGRAPLPPYIRRPADAADRIAYQTVYAHEPGAIAAPTAGLHFTTELLDEIRSRGVDVVFVTLHIGLGTFQPIAVARVEHHHMAAEHYTLNADAAARINRARSVWAVGTSVVRTLETAARHHLPLQAGHGASELFVYPPFEFRVVNHLVTNFHLPASTPLLLVSAFAGRDAVLAAYEEAKRECYRFLSYGDAMAVL